MIREAIVLVGGRGTRLQTVVSNVPKPLAQVAGRPFLTYLLDHLEGQGIERVVLSTGHLRHLIREVLGDRYAGISLAYAEEEMPLGTGGALRFAMTKIHGTRFLAFNGDTYFPIAFDPLARAHAGRSRGITIALRQVPDVSRFGSILTEGDAIKIFDEKGGTGEGWINGGIYAIEKSCLEEHSPVGPYSLEKDLMPPLAKAGLLFAHRPETTYFIDLGVPKDFERAQTELPAQLKKLNL